MQCSKILANIGCMIDEKCTGPFYQQKTSLGHKKKYCINYKCDGIENDALLLTDNESYLQEMQIYETDIYVVVPMT